MSDTKKRSGGRLPKLAARQVHAASAGDHGDGGGLILRVRADSAIWVFRYTAPSARRREMGLGIAPRQSVAQAGASLTGARELADKVRKLLSGGVDPLDERDRTRQAAAEAEAAAKAERARETWTLARCARDYHERVIERTRTPKHAAQWISSLENHIPAAIWHAPIADVKAPELLAALSSVTPHEHARNLKGETVPETVRRIRQRIDAVFEDAVFHERAATNPAAAIRRKMTEGSKRERKGKLAALAYAEAPAFAQRLRAAEGTAARTLEFAILTAARTSEAIYAEWREVDLDAATWTVPGERMKAGEDHVVYLSARAVEILRGQIGHDARLIFPSTMREGEPQSNMAMLAVLDRLGMRERTTVHGLCRATFSTWANETGAARSDAVEACLAHKESDRIRASYNRADFATERRDLLAKWAEFRARPAAPVIALSARAA
ncbi:MAG: tyrosine-type recombinase/integrase [Burkholderiaceae bacterium]|nr:tyrosine-type recombinase/integrase [Burkholderiaceae bacterium]